MSADAAFFVEQSGNGGERRKDATRAFLHREWRETLARIAERRA